MNKFAWVALLGTSLLTAAPARAETKSSGKTATSASKSAAGSAAAATAASKGTSTAAPSTSTTAPTPAMKSTTATPVGTAAGSTATGSTTAGSAAAGSSAAGTTTSGAQGLAGSSNGTSTKPTSGVEASTPAVAGSGDANGVTEDPNSPFEKRDTTYHFVGARFRYVIVPKFYMGLFGDGGTTVGVPAFGPEFTIRRNGFEYVFSAMYASYAMDPTPFKAKSDTPEAWEIVQTNIKALYLMSDFLWSSEMSPKFAINYGAGFGLAVVLGGDINRQQAYPNGDASNPSSYVACPANAAGSGPASPNSFCDTSNNHYGNYSEPSWANGGSKPIIFPWLSVQTGFRWKPVKQFAARFDIGWNLLNGPFFGLAANYGL